MYDSDGDAAARERFLESAAEALANGRSRLAGEAVAHVYKTKSAFRSAKRLIRSERYCFPNGRPQEAVITLANPFGRELTGTLAVTPPDGWQARPHTARLPGAADVAAAAETAGLPLRKHSRREKYTA